MLLDRVQINLTPREAEVLHLVANGMSAKEVAGQIKISPRTVERHIEHVRLKLRARNRPHMVTEAIARGILVFHSDRHAAQFSISAEEVPISESPTLHLGLAASADEVTD